MNAEERTLKAIALTKAMFETRMKDPWLLVQMAAGDVAPDDVEDVVTEILEYLEKTKEEESKPERH